MIAFGASDMMKAYIGSTEASKAYLGDELVWGGGSPVLPYDAEVEFLQSSGTQYIQLSLSVSKSAHFEVGFTIIPVYSGTGTNAIFSANPYAQCESRFYSNNSSTSVNTYDSRFGNTASNGGWNAVVGTPTTVILSTTEKNYNGNSISITRPLTANITAFRIFGGYRNNSRYPVKFRSFYIKVNGNKVYDLIAVRVKQVGYMYDKLSGELYGNKGSGSFTLGADV